MPCSFNFQAAEVPLCTWLVAHSLETKVQTLSHIDFSAWLVSVPHAYEIVTRQQAPECPNTCLASRGLQAAALPGSKGMVAQGKRSPQSADKLSNSLQPDLEATH